ncbi:MAG TPA: hydroxyacylglutathione hydrolase C-terminal domain-containing protein [Ideonella sp.]|uniref:hydroxyacylglutathione hydrolase C-terminal domain-containing protein n=1 Tax=Ideonella sp. TaxID=1929293 RepID=UPI002E367C67|nr:hydroxyacylglutathione hydrolase C-terminal domain-containing protein [Ideonella sp.]HEX5687601.1 hydroxyacylglutathione hydrolase C-terminal domain-containing protein [Ideonella sp.]
MTQHVARCDALRAAGRSTSRSIVGPGQPINPVMCCGEPAPADAAHAHGAGSKDLVEALTALRQWKNKNR